MLAFYPKEWPSVIIRLIISVVLFILFRKKPSRALVGEAIVSVITGGLTFLIVMNALRNGL
jgi:uncharacterized MnhB-related membrane protein